MSSDLACFKLWSLKTASLLFFGLFVCLVLFSMPQTQARYRFEYLCVSFILLWRQQVRLLLYPSNSFCGPKPSVSVCKCVCSLTGPICIPDTLVFIPVLLFSRGRANPCSLTVPVPTEVDFKWSFIGFYFGQYLILQMRMK